MKIIFKEKEEENDLRVKDVPEGRFFVDGVGYLCLMIDKNNIETAKILNLAYESGEPVSFLEDVDINRKIERILPEVEKIKF